MKLHYYPETDSACVEFSRKPGAETREVGDGLNIDLGANGELIGIEIEHASKHLDPAVTEAINRERSRYTQA